MPIRLNLKNLSPSKEPFVLPRDSEGRLFSGFKESDPKEELNKALKAAIQQHIDKGTQFTIGAVPGMITGGLSSLITEPLLSAAATYGEGDSNVLAALTAWKKRGIALSKVVGQLQEREVPQLLKDTVVVGSSGRPATVYHGTTANFDNFLKERMNPASKYGPGLYFTESPTLAGNYTDPLFDAGRNIDQLSSAAVKNGPNVRPVHLNIKRPFNLDGPNEGFDGPSGRETLKAYLSLGGTKQEFIDQLKAYGFDGMKQVSNIHPVGGSKVPLKTTQNWIAFDPEQVISKFDPKLSNLTLRPGDTVGDPKISLLNKAISDKNNLYFAGRQERLRSMLESGEIRPHSHSDPGMGKRGVSTMRNLANEFVSYRGNAFVLDPSKMPKTKSVTGSSAFYKTQFPGGPMATDFEFENLIPGNQKVDLRKALKAVYAENPRYFENPNNYYRDIGELGNVPVIQMGDMAKQVATRDNFVQALKKGFIRSDIQLPKRTSVEVDPYYKTTAPELKGIDPDFEDLVNEAYGTSGWKNPVSKDASKPEEWKMINWQKTWEHPDTGFFVDKVNTNGLPLYQLYDKDSNLLNSYPSLQEAMANVYSNK